MTFGHYQVGDPLNGIFLLDITDHYPIFIIAPINHSGQNLAELKIEVEHSIEDHVQINQEVSSNTNNF